MIEPGFYRIQTGDGYLVRYRPETREVYAGGTDTGDLTKWRIVPRSDGAHLIQNVVDWGFLKQGLQRVFCMDDPWPWAIAEYPNGTIEVWDGDGHLYAEHGGGLGKRLLYGRWAKEHRSQFTLIPESESGSYRAPGTATLHSDLPTRVEDLVGRVIGGGRSEDWWMGDRWHSLPDSHIREWRESPWVADCNTAWISLCTTDRAEMRSIPIDGTRPEHINQIKDKLALLYELGISPVLELIQQEFLTHVLGKDPARVRDYLSILGETYVRGNTACLIAMPTREMTEREVRPGRSQDGDVAFLASYLAATERACNDGSHVVHTGLHLRSAEPPTVGLFRDGDRQLEHPLWLVYDDFYRELSAPVTREIHGHGTRTFADVPEYYSYWDANRSQHVPNWGGMVLYEFGVPDTVPVGNWGPGHSLDEVRRRGEIMRAANARADLAMGITYA